MQSLEDQTQTKASDWMCEPLTPLRHGKQLNFDPSFFGTKLTRSSSEYELCLDRKEKSHLVQRFQLFVKIWEKQNKKQNNKCENALINFQTSPIFYLHS